METKNSSDWRSTKLPTPVQTPVGGPSLNRSSQGTHAQLPKKRRWWVWIITAVIVLLGTTAVVAVVSFQQLTAPRDAKSKSERRITIAQGQTAADIGDTLEKEGIIQSSLAFQVYTQVRQLKNKLQAGTYVFRPSQSVETIVQHLVDGKVDSLMITILPGTTIFDIQKSLQETYGFTPEEVEKAFTKRYDHPLLADLPQSASLEGYIYPDTYQLEGSQGVEDLLERAFNEMQKHLNENKLLPQFKKHKLTLHQAITLASILEREVVTPEDERQVAQIFYKRLKEGMELGADSTFIYGAKVLGVEPRVSLDSPYNTRLHKGLPPGPISNMTVSALTAVGKPATGDYLYFVSGDDGTTHFSKTLDEHNAKTKKYCRENCSLFNN